jgi:CubicO group peptidase (beta-lactamase class C family)
MKSALFTYCFAISVIIFIEPVRAQNLPAELDQLFQQVSSDPEMHFNGIVLVADHGKIIYQNEKGYSDIGTHRLFTAATRFQLASLSKVFTAVAVMQEVEKGKLKLDDPLVKYLPSFPYPEITIRQLLSHTSGLPDFKDVYQTKNDHPLNNSDIMPALIRFNHLLAAPGTAWNYSSMGYALLANLVEKISGFSFPDYVRDFICKPAEMVHSYVFDPYKENPDSLRSISYVSAGPAALTDNDSLRSDLMNPWQTIIGPGLMVSTADDLLLFSQALYDHKILSAASQDEMYRVVKLADGSYAQLIHAPIYAGLGWGIDIDHSSGTIISHNGGSPGISTILLRNLQTNQTVIVLENTDNMAVLSFGVNAMNILNHKPVRQFGPPRSRL